MVSVFEYMIDTNISDSRGQRLVSDFVEDNYIPLPAWKVGDRLEALNYRIKNREAWEEGVITVIQYNLYHPDSRRVHRAHGWYLYTVLLVRESKAGHRPRLSLTEEKMRERE